MVTQEIVTGEFELLNSHALMLTTAKDYIKNSQIRTIIVPLINSLLARFQTRSNLETHLKLLVATTQPNYPRIPGYIGDNLMNLLCHLYINI